MYDQPGVRLVSDLERPAVRMPDLEHELYAAVRSVAGRTSVFEDSRPMFGSFRGFETGKVVEPTMGGSRYTGVPCDGHV